MQYLRHNAYLKEFRVKREKLILLVPHVGRCSQIEREKALGSDLL